MDLTTLIIAIVFIVICISPFLLIGINKRRKRRNLNTIFINYTTQKNLKITKSEFINNSIIGIDENKKVVVCLLKKDSEHTPIQVDLSEIKKCFISNSGEKISAEALDTNTIGKLQLNLVFRDKAKTKLSIDFYDSSKDALLNNELSLIKKWTKIIEKNIQSE